MDNSFLGDYKNKNTYVNWKLIKLLIEYNNARLQNNNDKRLIISRGTRSNRNSKNFERVKK